MSLFIKIINTMLVLPFIIPMLACFSYPLHISYTASAVVAIVFIILLSSLKRYKTNISLAQFLFLPTAKAETFALRQRFSEKFIFSKSKNLYGGKVQLILQLVLLKICFTLELFLNLCSAKKLIRPQFKAFLSQLNSNRHKNDQPQFSAKILVVSQNSTFLYTPSQFLHFLTSAATSNNKLSLPRTCTFDYTWINFTIILAQIRSRKVSKLELNPNFNPSRLKVNRLQRTKDVNKHALCLILALNHKKSIYLNQQTTTITKTETNKRTTRYYNQVLLPNLLRIIILITSRGIGKIDSGPHSVWFPWQRRTGGKQLNFIVQLSLTSLLFITPTTAQEVYGSGEKVLSFMNTDQFNLTCLYKNFEHPLKIIWKWESKPTSSSSFNGQDLRPSIESRPQPLKLYKTSKVNGNVIFSESDKVRLDRDTELLFNDQCDARVATCPAHLRVRDGAPLYSGFYSCQVSDTRGSATTMYDVDILEQAPPEDVQLKMLTATATYYSGVGGQSAASTQVIAAGEELTLECTSDGFPSPMIKFMLNGNDVEYNKEGVRMARIIDDTRTSEGRFLKRTIKIDQIGLAEDKLNWSCQANNQKGYDVSDEIYTEFKYKPSIVTSSLTVEKRVRMNSAVDIICDVKPGNPAHTEVSWVQGKDGYGNTVANGNRLLWSGAVVEPAKTGFYTCVASNAMGRSTFTIHIIIEYPPVVQISPTVTSVEEGTELVLVCDIDAEPKEVQIEWAHQSIELQDTHRNVLSIPNVTRSHGGRYTCTVKNEHGSASKSAQVTILYRPNLTFRLQPNKRAFLEGDSVTITCLAQANPEVTELTVIRRDATLPDAAREDSNRSSNKKSYSISSLNRTHSGLYRCSAKNTVGRSTEEIDLNVQHAPVVKMLSPQVIDEGQALRMRCDVDSDPPAKISWFSPDMRLIKTGEHLVMEKMSQSDAGAYQCKAETTFFNGVPQKATMDVKVFVRFPPQYLPCSAKNLEGIFSSLPGESAKLCCQFILYPTNQPERVQWFRNTRENSDEITQLKVRTTKVTDPSSSEYQVKLRSELTISEVSQDNFTDYFCAVKNDKGEQFKKIRLNQLRTPPAPTIQDVKPESNALRVSWSPVSYMTSSESWYEVGYRPTGKSKYQTQKAGNNNELVITSLKPNQKYDVSVKACNSVGCSDFTAPKQGIAASRAGGAGGGGSGPGGTSSVAGSNNVPLRTMVIVPLVVFGLVLLISLLIVICRRNRDQRRNAALKKGIAAHPEELEVLKQNQVNSLPPPPGPPILNNNGINNSNNLNINTLSSIISNTSNDLDQNNPKLDSTYVDYSLGPPGSTSYQMLSPKHPNITSATQQPNLVSMGTMGGGNLGGPDRPPNSSHQLQPQQPGMLPPASVINMSGSLDKASFNRLRGEPEGKERVRFADADGNTLYPGDVEPHAPPVHHHTLTNGKLPHQNGGPNYNPGSHRYSTLPNKLSPPGSNVVPVASTSHSPPIVVNLHPGGLAPSGQQIPVSSIPTSESAQEHIYSTTSRVKPAPLPRAPSTNLSQSQLSNSSTSSVGSKSPPPPTLPPAAANGPILKKGPTNAARNLSEAINPPVSIEGDHKTLTLKCPSGYSITSV